ncbi:DNA polymerase III subunit gamma/tau, partial [Psychrobacter sp. T6-1]|uniref:DNA polymerase III subunit gamma/tau n=1 Tax=Psychrobacter sp. T6-1 TaxID=3457447 RepID=UPI003FCFDFB5
MSQQYQVLARKYRPKNFHELIGQTHVSQALINAIDYNRLHHAYLFTGTRGVGKTTIARILSKCLNCDTGITSTPCGVCDNCVAIDQGRFIDLIEIDAASRTKVEDTRELLDNVPYAPSQGRYKVYLIDEVHMLSTHSFNALLKTLEEPPEHVKFLLATTDPQKLPITIISRCLQFVLRPLPQTLLSEHLANVLTQEQVSYTQPALWQLASAAKGSVRDALSLTDQAIAFGQGGLDDATVNAMLGLIDAADLVRLIIDIYNHNKSAVAAHIEQMRAQMVDATSMFDGLTELLHQLALTQLLPEVALNVNEAQAQDINALAGHISPDVLQLYYEIVVQAREGIKLASTPMQALEMCILRLLAFRPLPVDHILAPVIEQDNSLSSGHVSSSHQSEPYDISQDNSDISRESLQGFQYSSLDPATDNEPAVSEHNLVQMNSDDKKDSIEENNTNELLVTEIADSINPPEPEPEP